MSRPSIETATMTQRERSAGFSLVEVIVAMGMLAWILIAIAGLLSLGGRHVKSGRSSSQALAVARDIVEEIDGWGFHQTYTLFGKDGLAADYTIRTDELQPADYVWQAPGEPTWQDALTPELFEARAEIRIESLGGNLAVSNAIRVGVTVSWMEGQRPRNVRLALLRN